VDGGATASYVYDANGQRVRKASAAGTVDYLYDLEGHQVSEVSAAGAWNRGEMYVGGRHLATYSGGASGATYFIHADWLGTERARSTMAGAVCETVTSLPFGDGLATSGTCGDPSPLHFTGKQHDAETNLDDFDARYYSAGLGRFMIPDWAAKATAVPYAKFGDPQSLNLYAYVRNNPLSRADTDGHEVQGTGPGGEVKLDFSLSNITANLKLVGAIASVALGIGEVRAAAEIATNGETVAAGFEAAGKMFAGHGAIVAGGAKIIESFAKSGDEAGNALDMVSSPTKLAIGIATGGSQNGQKASTALDAAQTIRNVAQGKVNPAQVVATTSDVARTVMAEKPGFLQRVTSWIQHALYTSSEPDQSQYQSPSTTTSSSSSSSEKKDK
jgi:RHS repeat-associated protein